MKKKLTQKRLKEVLSYDPKTGIFVRKVRVAHRVKVGDVAGSLMKIGYLSICVDGKRYLAHRLAWFYVYGRWPRQHTDHINGIKTDNRICNLRAVTPSQNQQNRKGMINRNSKSGLLGAIWSGQRSTWVAEIKINRKVVRIGSFRTPELAHAAYLAAKAKLHPCQTIVK